MKKALFVFAAAAAMLAGCQMAEDFSFTSADSKGSKAPVKFTASFEESETRAALVADGDAYKATWLAGDRVVIKGQAATGDSECIYTAGEGGSTYTYFEMFLGDTLISGPFEAFYPATVANGFPGVQSQDGNTCKWIPMRAFSSSTDSIPNLTFKNLGGMLKLNIKTSEAGIVVNKVVVTTDQPMAGTYTLNGDAAVIAEDGQKSITLDCGEGIAISSTATPFFISVPANTYTGMTIQLYADGGKKSNVIKMKSGSSFTVERSKYYEAEFAFNTFETVATGGKALLPSGMEFNTAIKNMLLEGNDYTVGDYTVTKIIFDANSAVTEGTNIAALDSEKPVYATVDKVSGIVTISTPASEFVLPEDASYMFAYFGALEEIVNLTSVNTENVMNMSYMFCLTGCDYKSLKSLDLSNFNTAKDTSMRSMFNGCTKLEKLDVSKFNTENVESFMYMFQYCSSLTELDCSNFNTSKAYTLAYMFAYTYALEKINIKGFDAQNVESVAGMFRYTSALQEIQCEPLDLTNCTTVAYMFAYTGLPTFKSSLYLKNTENVGNFGYMFQYAQCYSFDFTDFCTESATSMDNMFSHCINITSIDLSMFDVSNMDSSCSNALRSYFNRCDALQTINLKNWELNGAVPMTYMFYGLGAIKDIYLGEGFLRTGSPSSMWTSSSTTAPYRTGAVNGKFNIHCTQSTADWLVTTTLRWIKSGYKVDTPCDVHFLDIDSDTELTVTWSAD